MKRFLAKYWPIAVVAILVITIVVLLDITDRNHKLIDDEEIYDVDAECVSKCMDDNTSKDEMISCVNKNC
jgi:hypothetical protein